jgi:pyruvate dehydrogenase E2 component (dihydrolipoamide acetyltransferase)
MDKSTTRGARSLASPRARRAMRLRGIAASQLTGSGPQGRILEADVLGTTNHARASNVGSTSAMRRMIARATTESITTIPHFYLTAEVECTQLIRVRSELLPRFERDFGVKPSITDFILRAMALTLREQPMANRVWRADALVQLEHPSVGLVVGLDDGLAIPVIEFSDTLHGTARSRADLTSSMRLGALPSSRPCASSLSNLGTSRVDSFTAVIPLGQSSILAAGRVAHRAWAIADTLCSRPTMQLTLSVDHRVFDGLPAAKFLGRIVEFIEQPNLLAS